MKPNVKAAWLKALRSGDYQQTTGTLTDEANGYCCLGVLCEVALAAPDGPDNLQKDGSRYYNPFSSLDSSVAYLPRVVSQWADIPEGGEFDLDPVTEMAKKITVVRESDGLEIDGRSLSGLNDRGATFAQIADIIEREF